MEQEKINKILELHKKWLRNDIGGVRANLTESNLYGANLTGANLNGANLTGADLTRANLYGANFCRANFYGANLTESNLYGANLNGADLTRADLTRANLSRANLSRANLYEANLYGANGNNNEIKTIQTGSWIINYTDTVMQIGCEKHTIDEWMNFDDEKISSMAGGALEFWKKWKPILKLILKGKEK